MFSASRSSRGVRKVFVFVYFVITFSCILFPRLASKTLATNNSGVLKYNTQPVLPAHTCYLCAYVRNKLMFNFQSVRSTTWSVCVRVFCRVQLAYYCRDSTNRGGEYERSTPVAGASRISVNFLSFCRLDGSHLSCNIPSWPLPSPRTPHSHNS